MNLVILLLKNQYQVTKHLVFYFEEILLIDRALSYRNVVIRFPRTARNSILACKFSCNVWSRWLDTRKWRLQELQEGLAHDDDLDCLEWMVSQTFSRDDPERLLSVLDCQAHYFDNSGLDMSRCTSSCIRQDKR